MSYGFNTNNRLQVVHGQGNSTLPPSYGNMDDPESPVAKSREINALVTQRGLAPQHSPAPSSSIQRTIQSSSPTVAPISSDATNSDEITDMSLQARFLETDPKSVNISWETCSSSTKGFSLAVLSNGLFAAGGNDDLLHLWDFNTGKLVKALDKKVSSTWTKLAELPNNIVAMTDPYGIYLRNFDNPAFEKRLDIHASYKDLSIVYGITALPTGLLAASLTNKTDSKIGIWNADGIDLKSIETGHSLHRLLALPNGLLAGVTTESQIQLWDIDRGVILKSMDAHKNYMSSINALPNGRIACGFSDGTIEIWDVEKSELIKSFKRDSYGLAVVQIFALPNGLMASCSQNRELMIWDVEGGKLLMEFATKSKDVIRPTFLQNGSLAAVSNDFIKSWRIFEYSLNGGAINQSQNVSDHPIMRLIRNQLRVDEVPALFPKSLEYLDLSHTCISDELIKAILNQCPRLKEIKHDGCGWLSDAGKRLIEERRQQHNTSTSTKRTTTSQTSSSSDNLRRSSEEQLRQSSSSASSSSVAKTAAPAALKLTKVLYDYTASYEFDLTIEEGDLVQILDEDPHGWKESGWTYCKKGNIKGYITTTYLDLPSPMMSSVNANSLMTLPAAPSAATSIAAIAPQTQPTAISNEQLAQELRQVSKEARSEEQLRQSSSSASSSSVAKTAAPAALKLTKVLYDYTASYEFDLTIKEGDLVQVLDEDPHGWKESGWTYCKKGNIKGYITTTYLDLPSPMMSSVNAKPLKTLPATTSAATSIAAFAPQTQRTAISNEQLAHELRQVSKAPRSVKDKPELNAVQLRNGLSTAVRTKDINEVNTALELGALPDSQSLTLACWTGNIRIVRLVLAKGAEPDDKTMAIATKTGNQDIINLVTPLCSKISAVAHPAMASDALTNAVKTGNQAVVRDALEKGAKPDKFTLHWACNVGDLVILKAVIAFGAKANPVDNESEYVTFNHAIQGSFRANYNLEFLQVAFGAGLRPHADSLSYALTYPNITKEAFDLLVRLGAKPDQNTLPRALLNKMSFVINDHSIQNSSFDAAEMAKVEWHKDLNFYRNILSFLINHKGYVFPSVYPYRFDLACKLLNSNDEWQQLAIKSKLVTQADFDNVFKRLKSLEQEKATIVKERTDMYDKRYTSTEKGWAHDQALSERQHSIRLAIVAIEEKAKEYNKQPYPQPFPKFT